MYITNIYNLMSLYVVWKENGFVGAQKLWEVVKKQELKFSRKEVFEFVNSQKTAQVHKPDNSRKVYFSPIVAQDANRDFQMDLLDFQKLGTTNKGFKWLLVIIDIFDRVCYAYPLKNKTTTEVAEKLKKFFEKVVPERITSDDGKEWMGAVKALLKEKGVEHRVTEKGDHRILGVIDRMSKTIKDMLYKYFTEEDTTNWQGAIDGLIEAYNERPHNGVCNMSPNEAKQYSMSTRECHLEKVRKVRKYSFKVGDMVRVRLAKSTFERGFDAKYSQTIYTITEIQGNAYLVSNGKSYRGADLQKVEGVADKVEKKREEPLKKAKVNAKKRRLAFKESAVGHEVEKITDKGEVVFKKRLQPNEGKRTKAVDYKGLSKGGQK